MYASDLKEGNPVVLRAKTILLSWFKKKKKKNLALLNYAIIYTYCFRCKIHRLVDCLTTIRNPCRSCSCGCTHIHRHSAFPKLPRCNCTIHWMADMQIVLKYMTKKKNKQFFYLYKCFSPAIRYDIIVTEWNVIRFTIHKIVFFFFIVRLTIVFVCLVLLLHRDAIVLHSLSMALTNREQLDITRLRVRVNDATKSINFRLRRKNVTSLLLFFFNFVDSVS